MEILIIYIYTSLAYDVLEASKNDIEVLADLKNAITVGNAEMVKYKTNFEVIIGTAVAGEAIASIIKSAYILI